MENGESETEMALKKEVSIMVLQQLPNTIPKQLFKHIVSEC